MLESVNEVCEGVAGVKNQTKESLGHRHILHQKCPYFFDLIKQFRKKPISPFHYISKKIGFFSEPFDQIRKVMTFLMQNRPMAYKFF